MARTKPLPWIAESEVIETIRMEPLFVLLSLVFAAWAIYKIFLRDVSPDRHKLLGIHFQNLAGHVGAGLGLFGSFVALEWMANDWTGVRVLLPYAGFLTVIWGCIVFIKTCRILAFEYLFLGHMRARVPLLLVNIFTLVLSLIIFGWLLTNFFGVDLTPLLATSAVLSIVLGLALQDTLGNLFAGIALQFDKPFEIGDWIEIKNGTERIAGQVYEISWRATVLMAVTDELITIPNRSMGQWHISNYAGRHRPFCRVHVFRLPFGSSVEVAKEQLLKAVAETSGVLSEPAPVVIATDMSDAGIGFKVVYALSDYGAQFLIADRFLARAYERLEKAGIRIAAPRLQLEQRVERENSPV